MRRNFFISGFVFIFICLFSIPLFSEEISERNLAMEKQLQLLSGSTNFNNPTPSNAWDISGESRSIITGYDINGYTASSYYQQGGHYRQELDLKIKDNLYKDFALESFLSVRFTDDKYYDTETFSIESFYLKFISSDIGMTLGDFYSNFTNYTLNQSLKGINLYKDFQILEGAKLIASLGTTKARWEDLWKELDAEVYTRYVAGMRFQQDISKDFKLGLNLVNTTDDDDGSVDSEASTKAIKNRMGSMDLYLRLFEVLTTNAEFAYNFYNSDTKGDTKTKSDYATKLRTGLKIGNFRLDNSYELVGSNFVSPVGIATTDLEQITNRLTYKFSDALETKLGYIILHDNIGKQKSYTTTTQVPSIEVFIRPFEGLRYLKLETSYRESRRESSDAASIDDNTKTAYLGLRNRIKNINHNFGYRREDKIDDVTASNERDVDTYIMGLNTNFTFANIRFSPSIQYEIQQDKQTTTKNRDLYQNTDLGLDLYFPDGTDLELGYVISDTNYKVLGNDLTRTIALIRLNHKLFGDEDKRLSFSYEMRDYEKENASLSYTENVFETKLAFKF